MPRRASTTLLTSAPAGRHFAQLYREADALAADVAVFIEAGLRRGDAVIVMATGEHTERFVARLLQAQLDVDACRARGQLTVLDARDVLAHIERDGAPDQSVLDSLIRDVLDGVARRRGTPRVFEEMVDVLWRDGRAEAAIRLEEQWNELLREQRFCLFCAYSVDGLDGQAYARPLHEIGRTHTDIVPTAEDERLRMAVDAATADVLGAPLSPMLSLSGREAAAGEHRLPIGQRTLLWLARNMPAAGARVLERARRYYTRP